MSCSLFWFSKSQHFSTVEAFVCFACFSPQGLKFWTNIRTKLHRNVSRQGLRQATVLLMLDIVKSIRSLGHDTFGSLVPSSQASPCMTGGSYDLWKVAMSFRCCCVGVDRCPTDLPRRNHLFQSVLSCWICRPFLRPQCTSLASC